MATTKLTSTRGSFNLWSLLTFLFALRDKKITIKKVKSKNNTILMYKNRYSQPNFITEEDINHLIKVDNSINESQHGKGDNCC